MKNKFILIITCLVVFSGSGLATPIAGGEITYKYAGKNTYDVFFKYYRDCRRTSEDQNTFNFGLYCPATKQNVKLNPSLISIREVSTVCPRNP